MQNIKLVKKKLFDFLDLDNIKKVAIISDNDEDGLTAAVNGKLFFESNGKEVMVFFYDHSNRNSESFVKPFNLFKPDKTLFFDLNENFVFDIVQDINNVITDFVVIDHHQGTELVNISQNYLVIKPNDFSNIESSKYPASKMVFDLFGGKKWVAGIGVIGDFSFNQWDNFINDICNNFSKKELFEITEICSCIVSMHEKKIKELFDFLCKINNPKKILKSDFAKLNKNFQNLLNHEIKNLEKKGEFFDYVDLIFFETKPRLPSKLSTLFSSKNHKKTFIVYCFEKNFVKCSFRRQDFNVNCDELAKFSINGFDDSSAGGHFPASAARFPKKHFNKFKKNVIKYLEKKYSKK
ncbi:MAG: hypothetical protein PHP82_00385 [Candidatus ainarchaeum sp.]|nr:hypothetical protein [Candidatus ainarchaeum sp.]